MDELDILNEAMKIEEELEYWYRQSRIRVLTQAEKERMAQLEKRAEELANYEEEKYSYKSGGSDVPVGDELDGMLF